MKGSISADLRWNLFADLSVRFIDEGCLNRDAPQALNQELEILGGQQIDCQYLSGDP
jgi:hypothetical protein